MASDNFDAARDLSIPFISGESDFGWSANLRSVMTAVTQNDTDWARMVIGGMSSTERGNELLRAVVLLRTMWIRYEMEQLKMAADEYSEQAAVQLFDDSWPAISVKLASMWENGEEMENIDPPDPA